MENLVEKRQSLHKCLTDEQKANKKLRAQMSKMQSLANIGMVSAMAAHEMNNILTPLGNYAQLAMDHPDDPELMQKALKKTIANSIRATKILESMLDLASAREQEKRTYKLSVLIDEVFTCIARDFAKDGITVKLDIPEDLNAYVHGIGLQQVLMNLILNARESMLSKGGCLTISCRDIADSVKIEVSDTGCGIAPADMKNIFEPFYSTKTHDSPASRNGAGLGLAFCQRVIEEHHGYITAESHPDSPTTFKITLPKSSD